MPVGRDIHHDKPLSNLAVQAFDTGLGGFIAPAIFPSVPVDFQSDKYYIIEKGAFLRIHDTKRAPKTMANRVEFEVSSDTYYASEYALGTDNALQDLANADAALQLRTSGTELVTSGLLRDFERRVANKITSISNMGSGVVLSGSQKWSDYVGSDPVAQVNTAHAFIRRQTGMMANAMIIDFDTLQVARRHPALLDMFKYTSGGELTDAQLASLFKVQRILIGDAIMDNSMQGQTSSITNIWGNNVILARIAPPAGIKTATLGLSYRWTPEGYPAPFSVTRQSFSGAGTKNIEVLEAGYFQDEKIVARDFGYVLSGTL